MALKLSEAIRLGSMLSQQSFGFFGIGRCALQAATDAVGGKGYGATCLKHWPWMDMFTRCPACGRSANVRVITSICLNDEHHWTREQIADWVATIEPHDQVEEVRHVGQGRESLPALSEQPELSPVLAHPAVREGK